VRRHYVTDVCARALLEPRARPSSQPSLGTSELFAEVWTGTQVFARRQDSGISHEYPVTRVSGIALGPFMSVITSPAYHAGIRSVRSEVVTDHRPARPALMAALCPYAVDPRDNWLDAPDR
jgi:hypothetical protein